MNKITIQLLNFNFMFKNLKIYLITLTTFLILDGIWLTFVAQNFYKSQIGHLMSPNPNLLFALIFYLLFVIGLVIFSIQPAIESKSLRKAIILGGLFGFMTYATYDLTNLATLNNWPLLVTSIDLVWGTFVSATVSLISYKIIERFKFFK